MAHVEGTVSAGSAEEFPVTADELSRLRARLGRQAAAAGLLDVSYRQVDTPIGPLLLAATEAGLVRVAFEIEGFDAVLGSLAERIGPRILATDARLASTARQLEEYFTGSRRSFDVSLDWQLTRGFRAEVQRLLPRIAYGHTASYGDLARLAGKPTAVRAVGTACATNPLPVVVPCHRVLRADGSLGGYLGGPQAKTALLALERIAPPRAADSPTLGPES